MKKVRNSVLIFLIIFTMLVDLTIPVSIATENKTFDSLDTPVNLTWKEGSTATATWENVANANYYNIKVNVYNKDNELIGFRNTGTSSNEIDLQQEINDINYIPKLDSIYVSFIVQASYVDENINIQSNYSSESKKLLIEKKGTIKLSTPTDLKIDNDFNITWNFNSNEISNIDYFNLYCKIKYQGKEKGGYLGLLNPRLTQLQSSEFGITIQGDVASANIKEQITEKYKELGYKGETIEISFKVISTPISPSIYIESDYSDYSDFVTYKNEEIKQLSAPKNIKFDNDFNVEWNFNSSERSYIDYFNLYYKIIYQGKEKEGYLGLLDPQLTPLQSSEFGMTIQGNVASANIKEQITEKYKELGYKGETIEISFKVISTPISPSIYIESDYSDYSDFVTYKNEEIKQLSAPKNIKFDNDFNVEWNFNSSEKSYIYYFNLYYKIKYHGKEKEGYLGLLNPRSTQLQSSKFGMTIKGDVVSANIKEQITEKYKELGYKGETIEISFKVISTPISPSIYIKSDYSDYSNSVYYNPNGSTVINAITLSPNRPIIGVGRSMYIGKTIEPNNAIYDNINWSSSDNSTVSIDNMGQITGIKKGNATITAQINNAEQNAEVIVYEIETNISNEDQASAIKDEANDTIEKILYNGDITNTDIVDKNAVVSKIEQGAENGDMFNVDLNYNDKTASEYDYIKDTINNNYDGYNIAGGKDIKVEISHTDNKGEKHQIANITELENNLSIEFEIPSNIPQLERTKKREYKLLRIHNNEIEDIAFNVDNNTIETSSDKFSDFVVLYKDIEVGLKGDVDGDGFVTISDCIAILRHVKEVELLTGDKLERAKIDNNDIVTISDYTALLRHVKEIEELS